MLKLYLKLGVPTVLICAIAAAGLAGTYAVTKDRIAAADKAAQEKALSAAVPDAAGFEQVTDASVLEKAATAAGETPVIAVFQALDGSKSPAGWGIVVTPRGYGGPMTTVVGLDRNGSVTGVKIVTHNETPGLGTKAVGQAGGAPTPYMEQFAGIDSVEKAGKVDGITGATKSSRGVKKGIQAALEVYGAALKGLEGGGSK